jgi:RNA polymerase sigma factor (sigma-70 family)
MDRGPAGSVLRDVQTLYSLGTLVGRTDAELLEQFLARGDEAEDAFAALVHRHGPTVLGVCRRMLSGSHDAEDAFQATFLVLARRAASIRRRERVATWLYGVAVRIAREARYRAARDRAGERRLMDVTRVESETHEDRADLLPLLDEELNRLPDRYRAALLACELEGKSRRDAAQELGIPQGTLSTHLARGRKLLRERLQRRGVTLGLGPIAGLARPLADSAIPDRLIGPTVRAALAPSSGAAGMVPAAVASLAERVLKMMFLTRLTLIVAVLSTAAAGALTLVVLSWPATASAPQKPDPPRAGPDDLAGRVVDKAGTGMVGVRVWAMDGPWRAPETVAKATTDNQGRFAVPWPREERTRPGAQNFSLFARSSDGQVGWWLPGRRFRPGGVEAEIELLAVGDIRGRLTDQDGRPLAGVEVSPIVIARTDINGIRLGPEPKSLFRTVTAPDGSFVIKGIPDGTSVSAAIDAPAFGSPTVQWVTSHAVTIALDSRLGRIAGRLRPPDAQGPVPQGRLWLRTAPRPENRPPGGFEVFETRDIAAEKDGSFRFDRLPPGRYVVEADFGQDGFIATHRENEVEVGPGAEVPLEIPLEREPMITGRVIDARTGKGIAGMELHSVELDQRHNRVVARATTDADGRYRIAARPGKTMIQAANLPETYLRIDYSDYPQLDVKDDQTWPDLKLTPAASIDGVVVDETGRPVNKAAVYLLVPDAGRPVRAGFVETGPDGAFHFDQVDPDDKLALWAGAGDATTHGAVVVRPSDVKGKVRVTIDPSQTVRIRGQVTDARGQRIAGATLMLRWLRPYASEKGEAKGRELGSPQSFGTTRDDGRFVFRGLWPGLKYSVVVEARGYDKVETRQVIGKAGETHDLGKIVLINTRGYLAGRVVGPDGRPIVGAEVFNRGDGPEPLATSTDAQGRFRLDGMYPGTRFVFVRKDGYRFTGIKADDDMHTLTITLLEQAAPLPAWRPGDGPTYDQQRAFAKQVLVRTWEKYNAKIHVNSVSSCVEFMAELDPGLAREWSAEKGHAYDDTIRFVEARKLAEADPAAALALLNQRRSSESQDVLQTLAERYANADPKKARLFADEAAAQSRGLNQPDRTRQMARAGAVLIRLGRADAGRTLLDEAARDAAGLPTQNWAGYCRWNAARILAPHDVGRAQAILEPFKTGRGTGWQDHRITIGTAIGRTDTRRALAMIDAAEDLGSDREIARTAIAYVIARDRPDEAIRIVEDMKGDEAAIWQAEAFGWLAVVLAARDRARAYALTDRALALMIDRSDRAGRLAMSGGEMSRSARVAQCARQVGYPDMESVIMRVLAARSNESRGWRSDQRYVLASFAVAALPLALVDPAAARTVLEQVEARGGLDPDEQWDVLEDWRMAWALVDLDKARALFEADLAAMDRRNEVEVYGYLKLVEFLIAPPDRRQAVRDRNGAAGAHWRPDEEP